MDYKRVFLLKPSSFLNKNPERSLPYSGAVYLISSGGESVNIRNFLTFFFLRIVIEYLLFRAGSLDFRTHVVNRGTERR